MESVGGSLSATSDLRSPVVFVVAELAAAPKRPDMVLAGCAASYGDLVRIVRLLKQEEIEIKAVVEKQNIAANGGSSVPRSRSKGALLRSGSCYRDLEKRCSRSEIMRWLTCLRKLEAFSNSKDDAWNDSTAAQARRLIGPPAQILGERPVPL